MVVPGVGALAQRSNTSAEFQKSLRQQYRIDQRASFEYAFQRSVFTKTALEAYKACLNRQSGFAAYLETYGDGIAEIRLIWQPHPGQAGSSAPFFIEGDANVAFTEGTRRFIESVRTGSSVPLNTALIARVERFKGGAVEARLGAGEAILIRIPSEPKLFRLKPKPAETIKKDFRFPYTHPQGYIGAKEEFCMTAPMGQHIDADVLTFLIIVDPQYQGSEWASYSNKTKRGEVTERRACIDVSLEPVRPGDKPLQDTFQLTLQIVAPTYILEDEPIN